MRLILVRHGETRLNRDGRVQGHGDVPLNLTGRAQAKAAAGALVGDQPFTLYASPLARALETAKIISESLRVPLTPLEGLEEVDAGELAGLTPQEMRERHPDFMTRWEEDPAKAKMPGGESVEEARDRAWPVVVSLLRRHPDETVVAISHGFKISAIVSRVLDMPPRHFLRLRQDLGAITRLELSQDHGVLLSLNETWHLRSIHPEDDG